MAPRKKTEEVSGSNEPQPSYTDACVSIGKAMEALRVVAEDRGIDLGKGGKRYTQVQDRVEVFRREFGADYSIRTWIVHPIGPANFAPGTRVVICAEITNSVGFVVATGHAMEVVGEGYINKGSALENAETSAIGRALACLGLHGGEFASADEIDGHKRKVEAIDETPGTYLSLSKTTDDMETVIRCFVGALAMVQSVPHLVEVWELNKSLIDDVKEKRPELYAQLLASFKDCKKILLEKEGNDDLSTETGDGGTVPAASTGQPATDERQTSH